MLHRVLYMHVRICVLSCHIGAAVVPGRVSHPREHLFPLFVQKDLG